MIPAVRLKRWAGRHLDELLAVIILVWGLIATAVRHSHTGPMAANAAIVAALAGAMVIRRRAPLLFTAITFGAALIGTIWLDNIVKATWSTYILLVPGYTVAAYLDLRAALVGLAIITAATAAVDALQPHVVTDLVFTTIVSVAAWTVGRAMRHRRLLAVELHERAARVAAEREDRERLAVADERSRIARELHTVVANSVTAMVVQAEAAQRLLGDDLAAADDAMEEIESTGRETLAEMRRILGVLRRDGEEVEFAPQPGVGQIHTLIERARAGHRRVGLRVEGEPGPLPVSVDLAVYRIVEEALEGSVGDADIVLTFGGEEVELEIARAGYGGGSWPTVAMSERVALCEGKASVEQVGEDGEQLVVRLPQSLAEAFA